MEDTRDPYISLSWKLPHKTAAKQWCHLDLDKNVQKYQENYEWEETKEREFKNLHWFEITLNEEVARHESSGSD